MNWFVRTQVIAGGVLGGATMLLASFDLLTRYLWKDASREWFGEVVVYLVVWNAFLVCGLLVADDAHVRVDSLTVRLRHRGRQVLEAISDLLCALFCGLLAWLAATIAFGEYQIGITSSTPFRFPMWVYSCSLLVGSLLMAVHYLFRLYELIKGRRNPTGVADHVI